jgi:fluoride ion exporter CrcB/FEX
LSNLERAIFVCNVTGYLLSSISEPAYDVQLSASHSSIPDKLKFCAGYSTFSSSILFVAEKKRTSINTILIFYKMAKKRVLISYGVDVDAVAGWLGSYGGEDSSNDISRGKSQRIAAREQKQLKRLHKTRLRGRM